MVIYADVVVLLNLLIDASTLRITAWSRKMRPKPWRIWCSALIGAAYAAMMFVPALSSLFLFWVKAAFSAVMILIAFGFGGWRRFLGNMGAFYLVNFAAAGAIIGMHFMLAGYGDVMNGIFRARSGGAGFPLQIGLLFVLLVYFGFARFYLRVVGGVRKAEELAQHTASVQVWIGDATASCEGLIDTGNRLYEPLTRTPVLIMELDLWRDALGERWHALMSRWVRDGSTDFLEHEDFPWLQRMRIVPYKGIQQGTPFLLAWKPDRVVITYRGHAYSADKALVGLRADALSSDGAFRAIIHPDLVRGEADTPESRAV